MLELFWPGNKNSQAMSNRNAAQNCLRCIFMICNMKPSSEMLSEHRAPSPQRLDSIFQLIFMVHSWHQFLDTFYGELKVSRKGCLAKETPTCLLPEYVPEEQSKTRKLFQGKESASVLSKQPLPRATAPPCLPQAHVTVEPVRYVWSKSR